MKFELEEYHRGVKDDELLADLRRVATELKLTSLSKEEYEENGKYHPSTPERRFGSWKKAMELSGLEPRSYRDIDDTELLSDLKKVAKALNKNKVTVSEYKESGKYSINTFVRAFGSWFLSLEKAGLEKTRTPANLPEEELFKNLEEIWMKLGRQPNYGELREKHLSKYSPDTYARRFGSWRKALEAFVEFINKEEANESILLTQKPNEVLPGKLDTEIYENKHKTSRTINWRIRFIVMKRDNFRCKNCGRSPATDPTIILHVDHVKAWANGGETVLENLQTLCSVCNIGKSDLE